MRQAVPVSLQKNRSPRGRRGVRGMTLIEMIVVLAIVSLMLVVTAVSMNDGGKSQAVAGSVSVLSGAFGAARNEALSSGKKARLVVDSAYDAKHPDNFLHRVVLMQLANDGSGTNWVQVTLPEALPKGVFYSTDYSVPTGQMTAKFSTNGNQYYFEFDETGQLSPTSTGANSSRMVVTSGIVENGNLTVPASARNNRDGVLIHRLGRVAYFQNPADITLATP